MIKVINAHFVQSCERFSQAPSILGAEIAILGRSNVGKSSLINALLNNKNLAKSSSTPGKTRLINFFNAKWRIDSAESQNLGENISYLRVDSQNLHCKPPIENIAESQGGLPRTTSCARNDDSILDSAIPLPLISLDFSRKKGCTPRPAPPTRQKAAAFSLLGGEPRLSASSKKSAGGTTAPFDSDFLHHEAGEFSGASHEIDLDSANLSNSQNLVKNNPPANSSIVDEFLGFCEASDADKTNGLSRKRAEAIPKKSPQDAEFAEFEIRILDFPGFGYAKVSKVEKSSWDRNLSEFLKKRDSIKLYLHLIDSRHQNLEIDNEIFAFLERFKRGDSAILQVFTKADKLSKNELSRLRGQNKLYHATNDKNSTEILRCAILKMLYNVDF